MILRLMQNLVDVLQMNAQLVGGNVQRKLNLLVAKYRGGSTCILLSSLCFG
jgi:hypothetical protein